MEILADHDALDLLDDGSDQSADFSSEDLSGDELEAAAEIKQKEKLMKAAAGRGDYTTAGELQARVKVLRRGICKRRSSNPRYAQEATLMAAQVNTTQPSIKGYTKVVNIGEKSDLNKVKPKKGKCKLCGNNAALCKYQPGFCKQCAAAMEDGLFFEPSEDLRKPGDKLVKNNAVVVKDITADAGEEHTWSRSDREATSLKKVITTDLMAPEWEQVTARITMDLKTSEVIEEITSEDTKWSDDAYMCRRLPMDGVQSRAIQTTFLYTETEDNKIEKDFQ
jgi:hypothetical protein